MTPGRRTLLAIAAAACMGAAPASRHRWPVWDCFGHLDDLAALGRACRAEHPGLPRGAAPALMARLGAPLDGPGPATATLLARRIAADHAAGDTLRVDGWVLARSEVLLAALASQAPA